MTPFYRIWEGTLFFRTHCSRIYELFKIVFPCYLLIYFRLVLEYPATGGCIPYSKFRTLKLLRYVTSLDYFVMACELIFVVYLIYYSIEEIIEIKKHKLNYFKNFWNIFDVIVIGMGIMVVIFNLYRVMEVDRLLTGLLEYDNQYANFETLGHWQETFNDFIAVAVFFAWIKVSFIV